MQAEASSGLSKIYVCLIPYMMKLSNNEQGAETKKQIKAVKETFLIGCAQKENMKTNPNFADQIGSSDSDKQNILLHRNDTKLQRLTDCQTEQIKRNQSIFITHPFSSIQTNRLIKYHIYLIGSVTKTYQICFYQKDLAH